MAPLLLPPFWLLPFRLSRAPLTGSRRLPWPPRRRPRRPGRVAAAFAVEALVQGQRVAAAGLPRRMDAGHRGVASGAGPSRGGRVQRLHRVGAAALPFSTATAPDAGTRVQAHPREVLLLSWLHCSSFSASRRSPSSQARRAVARRAS